ncbi:MAG TPA: CPBP family intramembrane glutamic endopeptidase [Gaiellaceae bacterium]|nr:CPBP family intramembrane glutamic endopeptidase [Gaiellaceae bacterium]
MIAVQSLYAAVAVPLLVFAGIAGPQPRMGAALSTAAGVAVAVALYLVFARSTARPPRRLALPAAVGAVNEEIVWRWGALAGTAPYISWPGAFALSTVVFAGTHTRTATFAYIIIGGAFAAVFLATGQLIAAIAAHGTYNLLVLLWRRP